MDAVFDLIPALFILTRSLSRCAYQKKEIDHSEVIDPHSVLSDDEVKDLKEIFELFDEDGRFGNLKSVAHYCLSLCANTTERGDMSG